MSSSNKILSEILDFYKYKVDNNLCTMEEMDSALKALENNMDIYGTIGDFSKFYDTSESNVRSTINRKLFDKPKRILLYPFHAFRKIVPDKWLKKR